MQFYEATRLDKMSGAGAAETRSIRPTNAMSKRIGKRANRWKAAGITAAAALMMANGGD